MTERDLQLILIASQTPFAGKLFVPNISIWRGEADLLMLSKAGYATEFEIKVTRSDFKADSKKVEKHHDYKTVYKKEPFVWWDNKPKSKAGIPNYFYYVVPETLNLKIEDVPEYAGLIVLPIGSAFLRYDKVAPKLHKENFKDFWINRIAHSLTMKYYYHYFKKLKGKNVNH